jgi:hypothetical protein
MPEAVIVATGRTPIGRAMKGSLVSCRPDDLAALAIREVVAKVPQLDPQQVEDVLLGCGQPAGEVLSRSLARPVRAAPARRLERGEADRVGVQRPVGAMRLLTGEPSRREHPEHRLHAGDGRLGHEGLAEVDLQRDGVVDEEPAKPVCGFCKPGANLTRRARLGGVGSPDLAEEHADDLVHEVVPAANVVVERHGRNPERRGEVARACPVPRLRGAAPDLLQGLALRPRKLLHLGFGRN